MDTANSKLKSQPAYQALGKFTHHAGRPGTVWRCIGTLTLYPLREAMHGGRRKKGNHQLVIEKQAALVKIGRAGQRQLVVDDHRFGMNH